MTTHPVCVKCNIHYAVYGSDYCPKHGGVVPKTIKEYEEIRDSKLISGTLIVSGEIDMSVDWMAEARKMPLIVRERDDRLKEFRVMVSKKSSNLPMASYDSTEYDAGWNSGKLDAYREILQMIDSIAP